MLTSFSLPAGAASVEPEITGEAGLLLDVNTGQLLYEKNAGKRMYPASTTKILTVLLALEKGDPEERVVVSENAVYSGGSAIWADPGEIFHVEDLLWCLMLNSANDAATALAEHIGGSVAGFSAMMNESARQLGAVNSNFTNPHGLHDEQHYTTAKDLMLIAKAAMAEPTINKMMRTKTHNICRQEEDALSLLINTNKLLWRYEGAAGMKTGYTSQAGQCLVGVAEKDGRQLLSVVLNSKNDQIWTDTAALFDYGFDAYSEMQLASAGEVFGTSPVVYGTSDVVLIAKKSLLHISSQSNLVPHWEIKLNKELIAPLEKGTEVGELVFYDDKEKIGAVPLVVGEDVTRVLHTNWWYQGTLLLGFFGALFWGCRRMIKRRGISFYQRHR